MSALQNITNTNTNDPEEAGQNVKPTNVLDERKNHYITYVAAHGLSVEEDGTYTKISAQQFAESIGVSRQALYDWQKSIPDFWELVKIRRKEIFTMNRENAIWRGLMLRALKGDAKQAEMILSHFSDYTPPTQKHEVKVSGLGELYQLARQKQIRQNNAAK